MRSRTDNRQKRERLCRPQRDLRRLSRRRRLLAETEDAALKEVIAEQIKLAMHHQGLGKTAMAARMSTSRRQLDRLLDPNNPSVTLATLRRAATAVGRKLRVDVE